MSLAAIAEKMKPAPAESGAFPHGLALRVDRLSHRYGDLDVLDGIDLAIEPGSVAVLVGPSGCGKSTLLNIIGGNISLVLEDARLTATERARRIDEVLALTGLGDFKDAYPAQLSGGMRQRVGISRALSVRPACLLMDEPLSALDAQSRLLLLEEFAQIIDRARTTTVYVTHNLNEAVRLGHQIVVLSRRPGRLKEIIRIDRPITGRRPGDADLIEIEQHVWDLIRDEAAVADKELGHAGDH